MEILELLAFGNPLLLLTIKLCVTPSTKPKNLFKSFTVLTLIFFAAYGFISYKPEMEGTKLAVTLAAISPTLLPAIFLWQIKEPVKRKFIISIITALLIPMSMIAMFFLLLATDQIWGL